MPDFSLPRLCYVQFMLLAEIRAGRITRPRAPPGLRTVIRAGDPALGLRTASLEFVGCHSSSELTVAAPKPAASWVTRSLGWVQEVRRAAKCSGLARLVRATLWLRRSTKPVCMPVFLLDKLRALALASRVALGLKFPE